MFGIDMTTTGVARAPTLSAIRTWPPDVADLGLLTPLPGRPPVTQACRRRRLTRTEALAGVHSIFDGYTPLK